MAGGPGVHDHYSSPPLPAADCGLCKALMLALGRWFACRSWTRRTTRGTAVARDAQLGCQTHTQSKWLLVLPALLSTTEGSRPTDAPTTPSPDRQRSQDRTTSAPDDAVRTRTVEGSSGGHCHPHLPATVPAAHRGRFAFPVGKPTRTPIPNRETHDRCTPRQVPPRRYVVPDSNTDGR